MKHHLSGWFCAVGLAFILGLSFLQCAGDQDSTGASGSGPAFESSAGSIQKSCDQKSTLASKDQLGVVKVIVVLSRRDQESYDQVRQAAEALGGRITVGIGPEAFLAFIPADRESDLKQTPGVLAASSNLVDLQALPELSEGQRALLEKWNLKKSKISALSAVEPEPPPHDSLERPPLGPIEKIIPRELPDNFSAQVSREISPAITTAMQGSVAVEIFYPESNGAIDKNRENWTTAQIHNANAEIIHALDWWVSMSPPDKTLSFSVYFFSPFFQSCMFTSYEPIRHPQADEGLWMGEIMTCLGYNSGTYMDKVNSFNSWLASDLGTGQAYSVFVVNDMHDTDHKFQDGWFGYAYRGGPVEVMTYNNDGYGIAHMDSVHAHETGHIFWAFDEYSTSPCACGETDAHTHGCLNNNCEKSCLINQACVMRGQIAPFTNDAICGCTKGQIGWTCSNCMVPDCAYTVTSPNGGEKWLHGTAQNITWTATGSQCASAVMLKYYHSGKWVNIIKSTPNIGSYSWKPPRTAIGKSKVRVYDSINSKFAFDSSDGYFTIK